MCVKIHRREHFARFKCTVFVSYSSKKVNLAVIMPDFYFSTFFCPFILNLKNRQTIHQGQGGGREAAGTTA